MCAWAQTWVWGGMQGGGCSVQKSICGCAAGMGRVFNNFGTFVNHKFEYICKISAILEYWWVTISPLFAENRMWNTCRTVMGSIWKSPAAHSYPIQKGGGGSVGCHFWNHCTGCLPVHILPPLFAFQNVHGCSLSLLFLPLPSTRGQSLHDPSNLALILFSKSWQETDAGYCIGTCMHRKYHPVESLQCQKVRPSKT